MRKQSRAAGLFIAALVTTATTMGQLTPAVAAINGDRTDSPEYTESRADYWEARAAYEARRAEREARRAAGDDAPDDDGGVAGGGGSTGEEAVVHEQAAPAADEGVPTNAQLAALRMCESGDDYYINTGNGYYGAYQFSPITWWWLGYPGYPHEASPTVQDEAARYLYSIFGWTPWPACSAYLGFA